MDPATGRTAVGPGGGTVVAADGSGAELRIPAGAAEKGVVLKLSVFTLEDLPEDQRQTPDIPGASFGGGLKIESPDKPAFKKEVKLAFPLPQGLPENPSDAFFYVVRRIEGPTGADGQRTALFETIDHAFIEGEGSAAKVVTASEPFSGYLNSIGFLSVGPVGQIGVASVTTSYSLLMWSHDLLQLGKPKLGIITGKVLRQQWDPGAAVPRYEPVEGAWVSGEDAQGNPLLVSTPALPPNVARSQQDGTYTLWDAQYTGGSVKVVAMIPGSAEGPRRATAFETNPADPATPPQLRRYRNVATANINFPALAPSPAPPLVQIRVMRLVDGERVETNGLAVENEPLVIAFTAKEAAVQRASVNGREYGLRVDPLKGRPGGADQVLDPEFTPTAPGSYTVTATAVQPSGPALSVSRTFRVVAEGGSNNDPLNDAPPAVITARTVPKAEARDVPVDAFLQVAFTEPVRNVPGNVKLVEEDGATEVALRISGVGPDGPIADLTSDPAAVVTSLTLQPLVGLKYGMRYTLHLLGGVPAGIHDLDKDGAGNPAPRGLTPESSSFTTVGFQVLEPPEPKPTFVSPGLVLLAQRAFLVEPLVSRGGVAGVLRVLDLTDPGAPVAIESATPDEAMAGRPVAIAGEGGTVVVAMGPMARSIPSSLYVYDVSNETQTLWVGAVSVTSSILDGFVNRIVLRNDRVYTATAKKGIHVVDLAVARTLFKCCGAEHSGMVTRLGTDGAGFGQAAVVSTIPVTRPGGQPSALYDLEVGDFLVGNQSQPLVVATGFETPLVVGDPQSATVLWQGPVKSEDGGAELGTGTALGIGRVADQDLAVVAGMGKIGGAPKTMVAVVGLADAASPQALSFLDLSEEACVVESVYDLDVLLSDAKAYLGARDCVVIVSLVDPAHPVVAGVIRHFGGRIGFAPGGELYAATHSAPADQEPPATLRAASTSPAACELLTIERPHVYTPWRVTTVIDPVNGTQCLQGTKIAFRLCQAASVTFTIEDQPVAGARVFDDTIGLYVPGDAVNLALQPGWYAVDVPGGAIGQVSGVKPFVVDAVALSDPSVTAQERGDIVWDILNRTVLPVGHTFVKGVDLFDGHVVRQATDLKIQGRHVGLEVVRTYSSAAKGLGGPLGAGWSFNYGAQLAASSCGQYTVTTADGSSQVFHTSDNGASFTPQKGYHGKLQRNGDDSYDFIDKSGTRHHFAGLVDGFDPAGPVRLAYVEEPHGDRIVLHHDSKGRLTAVTEVQPERGEVRRLTFTYTGVASRDRIRSVEAQGLGIHVEYEYDQAQGNRGNLLKVTRRGGDIAGHPAEPQVEEYEYTSDDPRDRHQLTAAFDPDGNRTEYRYHGRTDPFPGDDDPKRSGLLIMGKEEYVKAVREFPDPGDLTKVHETRFAFDYTQANSGIFKTTVTDPRGNDTVYTLNADGGPTEIVEPPDEHGVVKRTTIQWKAGDVLKDQETDARNRTTKYDYDGRGNLISERIYPPGDPDGTPLAETAYQYHPTFNKLTFKQDAEGFSTIYTLNDRNGDLERMRDAAGNETTYIYDAEGHGLLKNVRDPRGFETTYQDHHPAFGHPRTIVDPLGNRTTRVYDARGRLTDQSDSFGHQTKTVYDGFDRVVQETRYVGVSAEGMPASRNSVTITHYTKAGRVHSTTNASQARTTNTLDGLGRVTATVTEGVTGGPYTTATQYDENGNKVEEKDRRDVRRRFSYDKRNRLLAVEILGGSPGGGPYGQVAAYDYDAVGNKVAETDVMGQTTRFEYDGLYRVERKILPETDPVSGQPYVERYGYDRVGNRKSVTDANGQPTSYDYDGLRRVTDVQAPHGHRVTTTYLDPEGLSKVNKKEERDVLRGLRTTYEAYDALNRERLRRVRLEGPGSRGEVYDTQTSYDDGAHKVTVTDPVGTKTEARLDGLDRPIEMVVDLDKLKLRTRMSYDGLGNRTHLRDPRSNLTQWIFDGLGRQTGMIDAKLQPSSAVYDGEGLKTQETDRRGVQRNFSHDSLGRPTVTFVVPSISGVGWSHEVRYDDAARKRFEKDARGHETVYDLDRMGRVVKVTDPAPFRYTVVTTYDGVGNKLSEKDRNDNVTRFQYDGLNRLKLTTDPAPFSDQTVEINYLDAANQVVEKDRRGTLKTTQKDPLGRVVSVTRAAVSLEYNEYDGNGNKTLARDGAGKETTFRYDGANRLKLRTDGQGTADSAETKLTYDANGNLESELDQRARDLGLSFSVKNSYDALSRIETTTDGEGNLTRYDYDPEGNRTLVKEPEGAETTFAYDELGKLLSVTQPGNRATEHKYDPSRNRNRQQDAERHVVILGYDELNRLRSMVQDPDGLNLPTTHDYDRNGNETLATDPKKQTVTTVYDELNRPTSTTYGFAPGDSVRPWRHTTSMAYHYDKNGNLDRVEESVASGTDPPATLTTTRGYDLLDRLTSETSSLPDGGSPTVGYTYFDNGTRKRVTDPADVATSYTYDGQNRLKTATTPGGVATYEYFPDDLLKSVTYANGVVASYGYDKADRLTSLVNAKGATVVSSYGYGYDKNGNRLSQVEVNGGRTEPTGYTYDALNRLETVTYSPDSSFPAGRVVTYGYDNVGNRKRETVKAPDATVLADKQGFFDNANRLIELRDLLDAAGTVTLAWDDNGSQVAKTERGVTTAFRYDTRNQLVETVQGASITGRFQYDFEGRRTKKIGADGIRQYVYDDTSTLVEYDDAGRPVAKYDYGSDRLISLSRFIETDVHRRFYSFDGLGSVTNLTNEQGVAQASYHLDPWGNYRFPEERTPPDPIAAANNFGFTGYLFDEETELYYAKARFYDPEVGRFISQDSVLGDINDPPSLHRFFYANDNPTRYTDPTGHQADPLGGFFSGDEWRQAQARALSGYTPPERGETPLEWVGTVFKRTGQMAWGAAKTGGNVVLETGRYLRDILWGAAGNEGAQQRFLETSATVVTLGFAPKYADELSQGRGGWESLGAAAKESATNLLFVRQVQTIFSREASNEQKDEALAQLGMGILGARTLFKGRSASVAETATTTEAFANTEARSSGTVGRTLAPAQSGTAARAEASIAESAAPPGTAGGTRAVAGGAAPPLTTAPARGQGAIRWVDENATMSPRAQTYQAGAEGARGNVATRSPMAPEIRYRTASGSTDAVRFDGVEGSVLIDRKVSVTTFEKSHTQALRQSEALAQNGLSGRWEVTTQAEANRATRMFQRLGITNIDIKVVPER